MQFLFSRNKAGGIEIKVIFEDNKLIGNKAKFKFVLRAMGRDDQRFDKILLEETFDVQDQRMTFNIPAEDVQDWLYKGRSLNVYYHAGVFVDGFFGKESKGEAVFNDDKYFNVYTVAPSQASSASGVTVNYWKTFLIMSFLQKFICLLGVLMILALIGNFISILFTSNGKPLVVFLVDHALLIGIGAFVLIIGCFVTATTYIKAQLISPLPTINKDSHLRLSKLIRSSANFDLRGLSVELVGYVMEKFQYMSGGENSSLTNGNQPANNFTFFTQNVEFLPKGAPIESSVSQAIDFGKFYSNLIPNFEISPNYGVGMQVELYIRSKDFPDIRFVLPLESMEKIEMANKQEVEMLN